MQYVRSLAGSVSKTYNSINPATLSGAIDVIVVEQDNGDLACSPFHVRFGKFSLLRPSEKKVEFRVNGDKTDFPMKLGEGGEAFFVFETSSDIPPGLQTSPLVSPAGSPRPISPVSDKESLQEPEFLNLEDDSATRRHSGIDISRRAQSDLGNESPLSQSPDENAKRRPLSGDWSKFLLERSASENVLPSSHRKLDVPNGEGASHSTGVLPRPRSPPVDAATAVERAKKLSSKLTRSNIPTQVTETGDLMLDMTGYKVGEKESIQAEEIARKILTEELEKNTELASLIRADEKGNLWIYASEEAKEEADKKAGTTANLYPPPIDGDLESGYSSDDAKSIKSMQQLSTPPSTPPLTDIAALGATQAAAGDPNRNYAKTLRLTSNQLKSLDLKYGANTVEFSVNRATCKAVMYYWRYDVPIVISDIDGTITKSDALGHMFTMIGRDWTHIGVAKLYTEIAANGYHILYLTSRSVGQADSTRNYLKGVVQDKYTLPEGPVIMSPDRTLAALRREVYLRKPEVFKMQCLRDILNLFGSKNNPFYAGFGNRLTDALSYRSVNIPSTRIYTIDSNGMVILDLLTLTNYKSSYVNMRDDVDQFFPPVSSLNSDENFTDFNYWRTSVLLADEFSDSDDDAKDHDYDEDEDEDDDDRYDDEGDEYVDDEQEGPYEDELDYDEENDNLHESFISATSEGADSMGEYRPNGYAGGNETELRANEKGRLVERLLEGDDLSLAAERLRLTGDYDEPELDDDITDDTGEGVTGIENVADPRILEAKVDIENFEQPSPQEDAKYTHMAEVAGGLLGYNHSQRNAKITDSKGSSA